MKTLGLIALVLAAMALPATAAAQSSADGYSGVAGIPTGAGDDGGGAAGTGGDPTSNVQSAAGGTLPFTGLELGLVAGGGVLLLGAGFTLRRLSASRL